MRATALVGRLRLWLPGATREVARGDEVGRGKKVHGHGGPGAGVRGGGGRRRLLRPGRRPSAAPPRRRRPRARGAAPGGRPFLHRPEPGRLHHRPRRPVDRAHAGPPGRPGRRAGRGHLPDLHVGAGRRAARRRPPYLRRAHPHLGPPRRRRRHRRHARPRPGRPRGPARRALGDPRRRHPRCADAGHLARYASRVRLGPGRPGGGGQGHLRHRVGRDVAPLRALLSRCRRRPHQPGPHDRRRPGGPLRRRLPAAGPGHGSRAGRARRSWARPSTPSPTARNTSP